MTISSTVRIAGPYIGSGAATVFPFAFKVFAAAEMQVAKLNTTSNVETILTLTTDYTVQLNGDQNGTPGGTITLPAVLASGYNLTITSDIANLQPTDLTNQGGFYPEVITDALDRATIQIQQLDQNSRAIKIPLSDGVLDMTTPVVSARQGKYLAFDSFGLPVVSSGTGSDSALRTDLANATAVSAGSRLSGFRQTGTGATAQTVDAKLKDTVSVKDFGAVGDGVTDDSLALENARIAAKVQNKPLYIPTGTYCFNELTIRASPAGFGLYIDNADGQEIYGDGVGRTILKNTSATGAGLRCASGFMNVHDLTIDNNNSTGSAYRHGGQYSSASNITIKNQGGSSYACVVDGSTLSNLSHIHLFNCTYGISVAPTVPTQYITFNNCSVENSSGTALYVGSSTRISFNQFYIEPTSTAANMIEYIVLNGSQNTTFNDFSCEIASGTLTSNAYFTLTNCKSTSFVNCKLNINDLASAKSVFTVNSCNGVSFINTYFVLTKATMTMVETITAMSYNIGMYHTNTLLTLVATGFRNTFVNTYLTIDQWVDHNNASSHVINAVNCSMKNMTTDIAITTRAAQLLLDCTGTISGSGATTATKINCNSGASTNIQNISGLNFLATQSASADANTLDDYEEGTWTPIFTNLTVVGTPTYYAGYIKIGKIVFCTVRITSTTTTESTANSTYLTVPFVNGTIPSTCQAVNTSTKASYGIGYVDTYCYTPTWAAVADVTISFTYSTAT